jgi:hypothetical protein
MVSSLIELFTKITKPTRSPQSGGSSPIQKAVMSGVGLPDSCGAWLGKLPTSAQVKIMSFASNRAALIAIRRTGCIDAPGLAAAKLCRILKRYISTVRQAVRTGKRKSDLSL